MTLGFSLYLGGPTYQITFFISNGSNMLQIELFMVKLLWYGGLPTYNMYLAISRGHGTQLRRNKHKSKLSCFIQHWFIFQQSFYSSIHFFSLGSFSVSQEVHMATKRAWQPSNFSHGLREVANSSLSSEISVISFRFFIIFRTIADVILWRLNS